MKRSNEEYIMLTLSFGGAFAIAPFALIRVLNEEWTVALVDCMLIAGMLIIGSYVFLTRKIGVISLIGAILVLSGLTVVIHLKGPSLIFWAYPTMVGVYFVLAPHLAIILTLLAAMAIMPALIETMDFTIFVAMVITLIANNLFAYVFATRMHKQRDQLSLLVRLDPLTGAGNRRALNEKLEEQIAFNKRNNQVASLIVLDIDNFKNVNDKCGHAVGDQVLINFVQLVNSRIRTTDRIFRSGGEEFVVILIDSNLDSTIQVAEELRLIIEKSRLTEEIVVTASLGAAEFMEGESAYSWMDRGDKAMYKAKKSGRNKTCAASY